MTSVGSHGLAAVTNPVVAEAVAPAAVAAAAGHQAAAAAECLGVLLLFVPETRTMVAD